MPDTYEHLFIRSMTSAAAELINEGEVAEMDVPAFIEHPYAVLHAADVPGSPVLLDHTSIHETDEPGLWVHEHVHDYDEVLVWLGSDPSNASDLGGELFIDIEGERYTTTTSGSVLIPAGMKHCPLGFTEVHRPFSFRALAISGLIPVTSDIFGVATCRINESRPGCPSSRSSEPPGQQ